MDPSQLTIIGELPLDVAPDTCVGTTVDELMQGAISGRQALIFNLRAYSAFGEGSTVTTFAAFRSPRATLPNFEIYPRNLLERSLYAWQRGIGHDQDAEFNSQFSFRYWNVHRWHEFLTEEKLVQLQQPAQGFEIRSSNNWLLVCRPGKAISAPNLRRFVRLTSNIASALLDPDVPVALSS